MTDLGESKAVPEHQKAVPDRWHLKIQCGTANPWQLAVELRAAEDCREALAVALTSAEATIRDQAQTIERLTKICCGALCLQCAKGSPVIISSAGYYSHQEEGNHCNASRIHKALEPKP